MPALPFAPLPVSVLVTVASMWLVAVAIPGPNFLVVARTAARSRTRALAVVAGVGVGTAAWGLAGMFGVHLLFAAAPRIYAGLKLAGAAYLVVLGLRILLASRRGVASPEAGATRVAGFPLGLLTNLSNPKTAVLVASLFATVMPQGGDLRLGLATVAEMVVISVGWYAALACLISMPAVAGGFARCGRWIDRLAGAIFIGFGARLMLERG